MEFFCVGDDSFCGAFAMAGLRGKAVSCADSAADAIISHDSGDIILIPEELAGEKNRRLTALLQDRSRMIVPCPFRHGDEP